MRHLLLPQMVPLVLLAGPSCVIEAPDYEQFNIACGAGGGGCPEGFVCGDNGQCRRDQDSTGGQGGQGGQGGDDGDAEPGGDGAFVRGNEDCPRAGFLSSCAGDYNLGITGLTLREITTVSQVCGDGTLVDVNGEAAHGAIAETGEVDYVDEAGGGHFSGYFDKGRCSGVGEWAGAVRSGGWNLKKVSPP